MFGCFGMLQSVEAQESFSQSVSQSVSQPVNQSVGQSVCQAVSLSVSQMDAAHLYNEIMLCYRWVVDDGVPCGGLVLPGSRNSPEAAKAILMLDGRNPTPAKRAAFRAFYL